ncbi:MAG: hypothetical protein KGZ83_19805, partial [Sulfuricella sp.]|nr:hypothetical protein [Sulfuricella sp.]
ENYLKVIWGFKSRQVGHRVPARQFILPHLNSESTAKSGPLPYKLQEHKQAPHPTSTCQRFPEIQKM